MVVLEKYVVPRYMEMYGRVDSSIISEFCFNVFRDIAIATILVINDAMIPTISIISVGVSGLNSIIIISFFQYLFQHGGADKTIIGLDIRKSKCKTQVKKEVRDMTKEEKDKVQEIRDFVKVLVDLDPVGLMLAKNSADTLHMADMMRMQNREKENADNNKDLVKV